MKTGDGYFATAPSDFASAAFSGDSKANHAIAGDSGGCHDNAGSFASLEQEMAMGRKISEQVRHACDDVMVLLICFCMNQTHPLSQADGVLMVHTIVQ